MFISTIEEKANKFSYITFKMQASMYGVDKKSNGLDGMVKGFNKLKKEENIPIFSYETIEKLI